MSSDHNVADGDPQARLERMKNEFLVAQHRRREKAPGATRPNDTHDGPLEAGPADGRMTAVAAVRP